MNSANDSIRRLRKIMQIFRTGIDDKVSVQTVQAFLLVCERESASVVELAEAAGIAVTTMSRALLDLSERRRNGEDGFRLLQRQQDPTSLRRVLYTLTSRGKLLRNQLVEMMGEEES